MSVASSVRPVHPPGILRSEFDVMGQLTIALSQELGAPAIQLTMIRKTCMLPQAKIDAGENVAKSVVPRQSVAECVVADARS